MKSLNYIDLPSKIIQGEALSQDQAHLILESDDIDTFSLVNAAYQVRKEFRGNKVTVHIINNVQNGHCPENCRYCAQAKTSDADIEDYGLKSDDEILQEAKRAYEGGAFRYCMVFAGRGPSRKRIERLSRLIRTIKTEYKLEVCVSAGLVNDDGAKALKEAGLDRLNHNLNTSERFYPTICTSHTYEDRINTLKAAQKNSLDVCSGVIVGMGETHQDIIDVAFKLREFKAKSIPVNFFMPIEGASLQDPNQLTPAYCLRVLALFRFTNPEAEIRMAAGREIHLRDLQVLGLHVADSLFLDGYLNTKGSSRGQTLRMIKDAGFNIVSDEFDVDALLQQEKQSVSSDQINRDAIIMKDLDSLRPTLSRSK